MLRHALLDLVVLDLVALHLVALHLVALHLLALDLVALDLVALVHCPIPHGYHTLRVAKGQQASQGQVLYTVIGERRARLRPRRWIL